MFKHKIGECFCRKSGGNWYYYRVTRTKEDIGPNVDVSIVDRIFVRIGLPATINIGLRMNLNYRFRTEEAKIREICPKEFESIWSKYNV